uniref:RRM domain-containing protein n=1 Tax=Parascaris univalens TaxID=6257 RepID=A0A915CH48_PARUN
MKRSLWWLARAAINGLNEHPPINQTVYLTHVKWVTGKSKQLEKYFSRFGPIKDVALFFDSESGLHRGFASLTFVNAESAAAAVQQRPHVIDGDLVGVEFSIPLKPKKKFIVQ